MITDILTPKVFAVRGRLIRRLFYRTWKSLVIQRAKKLVARVEVESVEDKSFLLPTIILSTYTKLDDFVVLTYLFKEHELTLLAPSELPTNRTIERLRSLNQILYIDKEGFSYSFLKELFVAIRNFNRSVVIAPDAGHQFLVNFSFDYATLIRIAMKTNVPIQPVIIDWRATEACRPDLNKKCSVFIGKRIFISPRHPDFRDIFFKRRGERKFSKLTKEEYREIADRILTKFRELKDRHGSNLS